MSLSSQPPVESFGAPRLLVQKLHADPVSSSESLRWRGMTAQRFQFGNNEMDVPGMGEHVLAVQLGGPVLMETPQAKRPPRQRWFERGTVNIIPAGQPAKRRLRGRTDVLTLFIAPEMVDEASEQIFGRDPAAIALTPGLAIVDSVLQRLGLLIAAELNDADTTSGLMAESLCRACAVQLVRCHSNLSSRPAPLQPRGPVGRMRRIDEFMREHLGEKLSLAQLALIGGVSPSHLVRAFREEVGAPPHQHLINLRIQRARELLEKSTLSVTEISSQCGFQEPAHFATTFRRCMGLSPRAWRKLRAT